LGRTLVADGAKIPWQVTAAALAGGTFLLCADVAGRLILPPVEVQAGIMVALVGGPAFAWIARQAVG
jgi:iron complex transport system permease protein